MPDGTGDNIIEMVGNDYPFFRHVSGVRDGLDLRYRPVGPGEAFTAVLENTPFQANEFSLANYTLMRDRGVKWMTAIPVFLNRAFRHGSLYVLRDSDINWIAGTKQRFAPPEEAGVKTVAGDLEQMVIDGAIDGLLAPSTEDQKKPAIERKLRPLLSDTEGAERDYYARTGIYPLNHIVAIHESVLARYPAAPKTLFDAYCASKKRFYAEGGNSNPWGDASENDFIPFGLTDRNREIVATLLRYLHEQKFIGGIPDIDPLFADGAAGFVDG